MTKSRKVRVMVYILAGVGAGFLGLWSLIGWLPTKGVEKPAYRVVSRQKGYEVREYPPTIVAEVTLEGEYKETMYGGFRQVADYIFGNNEVVLPEKEGSEKIAMTSPVLQKEEGASEKIAMTSPVLQKEEGASEKIAMTSPVLQEETADSSYTVSFIMPSEYTLESLPKPKNEKVQLRSIPSKRYAVLRFGGYATERRVEKKKRKLRELMDRDDLRSLGETMVAQYNPPWTPPYMRRNEILIEIPK